MLRRNIATIAALLLIHLLPIDINNVSASISSSWWTHAIYSFFHANLFHLAANAYSLCFIKYTWKRIIIAYLISIPASFTSPMPAVGFSGIIFVLLAMNMSLPRISIKQWTYFIITNICISLLPGVSWEIHISCFLLGFLYSYLNHIANDYRKACHRR